MMIRLILPMIVLLACATGIAQTECGIPSRDIIFIDTIEIRDPIVLGFVEPEGQTVKRTGKILVPRCEGDTVSLPDGLQGFVRCLTTIGFLFWTPGDGNHFINNALYHNPNTPDSKFLRSFGHDMVMREGDTVFIRASDFGRKYVPVYYRGLESHEIRQRRFWLFLVKNSLIVYGSSDEELTIEGNDGVYIRVLVPITR